MSQLQSFAVTPGMAQSVQLVPQAIAIKVTNKSYYDIQYSDFGTMGQDWLAAGTEYLLDGSIENNGKLTMFPVNTDNITPALPGTVLINTYIEGEDLPNGTWPISVPKSTVSTVISTTNALVNDGNAPGTQVLESTPTGQSGTPASAVTLTNDGLISLSVLVAGVLHQMIQTQSSGSNHLLLGNSSDNIEVLGGMFVDGALSVTGTTSLGTLTSGGGITLAGGDFHINGHQFVGPNVFTGGMSLTSGDFNMNTHQIQNATVPSLTWGTSDTLSQSHSFSGSGSGTFSHGCHSTPFAVIPVTNLASSSQTQGANGFTSTQVNIVSGNTYAWKAACFVG